MIVLETMDATVTRHTAARATRGTLVIVSAFLGAASQLYQSANSLVYALNACGWDVYVIGWKPGGAKNEYDGLKSYALEKLPSLLKALTHKPVPVIGVCQGGVLCLVSAAMQKLPASHLVLLSTPVNLKAGASPLAELTAAQDWQSLYFESPFVPGSWIDNVLKSLYPQSNLARAGEGRSNQSLTKAPDHPKQLFFDFVQLLQTNGIWEKRLAGFEERLRLRNVTQPVLSVAGQYDLFWSVPCVTSIAQAIPSAKTFTINKGFSGLVSGRHVVNYLTPEIDRWLSRTQFFAPDRSLSRQALRERDISLSSQDVGSISLG